MPLVPCRVRLTGATVLRDGVLQRRSVAIEDGRVSKGPLPEVDLTGFHILPGIVDLHAPALDAFGSLAEAWVHADRIAVSRGVTTCWTTQAWSWEGGLRAPEQTSAVLHALDDHRRRALCDLRLQLRCEVNTADSQDFLMATVQAHGVDSVLFENRLDGARLLADTDRPALMRQALAAGRSVEAHLAAMRRAEARRRDVPRHLCRLAEGFDTRGVVYGSLGDTDGETREYYTQIGAKLCALPQRRPAAALAHAVGDPILLAASDVLGQGPQWHMLCGGLGNVLVSERNQSALVPAAFRLVDEGLMGLPEAWAMLSSAPADIMRLTDRGRIDYGLRADLVVIHAQRRTVEAVFCEGRIVWLTGEAADRFAGLREARMAAE